MRLALAPNVEDRVVAEVDTAVTRVAEVVAEVDESVADEDQFKRE
jgi:hypothetical protein